MLYRNIIDVCLHRAQKHMKALCGNTAAFFNVKPDDN